MFDKVREELKNTLAEIEEAGLYKRERIIVSDQKAEIQLDSGAEVLNFCANNYLGLANDDRIIQAAKDGMDSHGFGLSSVRFICGTQDIHKQLEGKIAEFFGSEDTILYSSCFDANAGLFEVLLDKEDAIISDSLNHASIIDGVRLCKAVRYRYANNDMEDLRKQLEQAKADGAKRIMIATDGVFSMDGIVAQVDKVCDLADEFGAMVMVDDSHATGFFGATGRGSVEHCEALGRVDVITSTLGKAMGGASGGFTTGRQEIIDLLRQRSRPYLFSNTLAPAMVAAAMKTVEILMESTELRDRTEENTKYFREKMTAAGFDIIPGVHPIVPIMLGDAKLSQDFANRMLEEGIYVIGFFFPVVPREQARIRVQISAAHDREQLNKAIAAFTKVGLELGVLKQGASA
ncbi:MAG: glycine C-acetyltransferase [Candidatus Krumholzibacteria bacterium]|jgi:glycine C-acetyltransferase|nr:glycine C-acetyltransferase [Candidatus Krumholzibacteria bacterium]MDP6669600.1 glycine C-acetyltransferase [Candidatus Krumholzibacteria bacterium]MDP6798148.1 glycine C-acetyltransferase [Candidatus Krumholzibacteria bacterium]MDP7022005.1 glycine C-acetyltransferase [Candidatus Krumholzibacteria bacterium]